MDQQLKAGLKGILVLIVAACVFGCGTLWGLHLSFGRGSAFIAEEMARRNMDFAPMAVYLNEGEEVYEGEYTITVLDLNKATAEQLAKLPGVGETRAQAIVTYRDRYGRFNAVTDLQLVEDVSYTLCQQIAPYLVVK